MKLTLVNVKNACISNTKISEMSPIFGHAQGCVFPHLGWTIHSIFNCLTLHIKLIFFKTNVYMHKSLPLIIYMLIHI